MKNLKRMLTLVLTLALVFSLFAINASAASFSDNSTIVNKEAVSVMTELNIIKGYEDGSFKPTQVVTRAEMCKMLCVALNGGNDPVLGSDALSIFSDTKGHWGNAYIAYCFNLGLVNGDSGKGGTFRPDATVTGTEAAKMMLVAMGYKSEFAGFTGADWAMNVTVAANQKGLFDKISGLNLSTGLSRDNAAQLIYNGINADKVTYDYVLSTNASGELVSTARIKDISPAETILSKNYGATKITGVVKSNENGFVVGAKQDEGYTWIDRDADNTVDDGETFKVTTSADLLGQKVNFYVKANANPSKEWTVFGTPIASSDNKIVTFTGSKAPTQSEAQFDDYMKAQGISAYAATVFENYGGNANSVVAGGTVTTLAGAFAIRSNVNGIVVKFIDNNADKTADYVSIVKPAAGKVVTYSTAGEGYISVSALTGTNANVPAIAGEKFANVIGADKIAKDDYVTYYKMGTKWIVTKCNSVTANITATESPNALAGTTTYKGSNLVTRYEESNTATTLAAAVNLGKDCVMYTDPNGYVVFAKPAAADNKYLVVISSNDTPVINMDVTQLRAKVLFESGSIEMITVSKLAGTLVSGNSTGAELDEVSAANTGRIYTYKLLSDGTYDLTAQAAADTKYLTGFKTNNPVLTTAAGTSSADSKTLFVVANAAKTSATAYTGIENAPEVTGLNTATTVGIALNNSTSGVAKVVFAIGGTGATSAKYLFVLSKTPTVTLDSNGANVYTYKTLVNGVATDLVVEGAAAAGAFESAGLYRIDNAGAAIAISASNKMTVNAMLNNYVTAADTLACANNVVKGLVVNPDGTTQISPLTYNDSTKVYVIDGKTVTESSIGEVAVTGSAASTSNIIITRASNTVTEANYNVAGIVYIVKGNYAAPATMTMTLAGTTNAGAYNMLNAAISTDTGATAGDTITLNATIASGTIIYGAAAVTGGGAFADPTFTITGAGIYRLTYRITDTSTGISSTYNYFVNLAV